jgi:hypothetical protein
MVQQHDILVLLDKLIILTITNNMATPFNLFNFQNLGGVSSIVKPETQVS